MSVVYNPEAEIIAQIERLRLSEREMRRRVEHCNSAEDKRVLNRLLKELQDEIEFLRHRVP
jgi:hypothetical protein